MSAIGRRERTKAANREAILTAGRDVFVETGFDNASVRDIIRRTSLASGTFYNYFPDKEAVLHEILAEATEEIRVRVHAARRDATTVEEFVAGGLRAYVEYLDGDRATLALMSRNAGTMRAMFDSGSIGAGVEDLKTDLDAAMAAGLVRPHDTGLMAAAMVGAAVEVTIRLGDEERPDLEGAVELLTSVFVAGLEPR
ncbi:unannotated protein [freshwater metagenome]|uniref:Unannotated protein n=1 Tax=freshwater metagenome TaxID=449393 RepID=A0A6J7J327_9ZZZZ|nr:TetR family transcriptional regulator [Actinomycetota bacterium]